MYYLWDKVDNQFIGEYTTKDAAVFAVGMLMSYKGKHFAQRRYVITEKPDKKNSAEVVYDESVCYQRGLFYYRQEMNDYAKSIRGEL